MNSQNNCYPMQNLTSLNTCLFVCFLTLKLAGVINWSWWLVCLPLYFSAAIILGLIVIIGIGYGIFEIIKRFKKM